MKKLTVIAALALGLFLTTLPEAKSQDTDPRFGVSLNTMISTQDGFGPGFRFRGSAPVNQELSFAIDLGLTGFILGGRDDAVYVTDPQVSAIVSIPDTGPSLTYFLGGVGAYVPFGPGLDDDRQTDPTINLGLGQVRPLTDTSIFYEVNLTLIIGEDNVGLGIPIRGGVIF